MDDLPSTRQHPIYRVRRVRPKMAAGAGEEIWVIDQACSVKMAGYWPSSIFACLWSETQSRSINTQKKKAQGQYPAILTEQAWSIKGFLLRLSGNFSCGTRRVVPSGQDSSILPARVANHGAGFDSSCLLTDLAI